MIAPTLFLLLAAPAGPLVFRGPHDWVLVSREGKRLGSFSKLAGIHPADVAVSDDGRRWALTVDKPKPALFLWAEGDLAPRGVELVGDYAVTPSFSPDGDWVYFAQNDPSLPHSGPMPFAQLWKVPFTSGRAQRLSTSFGCHTEPRPLKSGQLLFVHADCRNGTANAELFDSRERVEIGGGTISELAVDPESGRVAFTRDTGEGRKVGEWQPRERTERIWTGFLASPGRARPAWGSLGSLYFQNGNQLMRISAAGEVATLFELGELE
jgi:hypothetical protein